MSIFCPVPLTWSPSPPSSGSWLLRANQVVPAEWLIEQVWGERPPATATKTLHNLVMRLHRVLPAGSLVTRAPGYLLQVEPHDLDLHCFHRLSREAAAAAGQGAHDRAAARWRAALALWRGPALADVNSETLRQGEARGLEELRLAALEARIDADLRLGPHGELVAELTGLVTSHPLRERFHAGLMVALYRTGRQADALAVYRELRGRLVDEVEWSRAGRCRPCNARSLPGTPTWTCRPCRPAGRGQRRRRQRRRRHGRRRCRIAAEPEAAAEVARLCGYLPLALRIAGARLAAQPTWPVRALADRLENANARLDELELADLGIRASVGVSYQQLQPRSTPRPSAPPP